MVRAGFHLWTAPLGDVSVRVVIQTSLGRQCLAAGSRTDISSTASDADAVFAFLYPNLMVNAYGPWVDTNLVMPLSADSCCVQFDWYIVRNRADDQKYIEDSIDASHEVHTCPA